MKREVRFREPDLRAKGAYFFDAAFSLTLIWPLLSASSFHSSLQRRYKFPLKVGVYSPFSARSNGSPKSNLSIKIPSSRPLPSESPSAVTAFASVDVCQVPFALYSYAWPPNSVAPVGCQPRCASTLAVILVGPLSTRNFRFQSQLQRSTR